LIPIELTSIRFAICLLLQEEAVKTHPALMARREEKKRSIKPADRQV
jgi:hypothetical protein